MSSETEGYLLVLADEYLLQFIQLFCAILSTTFYKASPANDKGLYIYI